MVHIPVLLDRVVNLLAPEAGQTVVDCTAGLGGHAAAIASRVGPTGRVVLNDLDSTNLARAGERVRAVLAQQGGEPDRVLTIHGNFADLPRELEARNIRAHMVLADLGFASTQVDDADRGFSFQRDGPLDMRMNQTAGITAAELVASLPENELTRVFKELGEEPNARRIAARIVQARQEKPISTTLELAVLVREAVGSGRSGPGRGAIDPATKTFQALRMLVNDELGGIEAFLAGVAQGARDATRGRGWLEPGSRVAVIAFHSLEDRPVKRAFAELAGEGIVEHLTPGPASPDEREVAENARSRSARLRAIRLAGGAQRA
ncbi:MAG: 16S rRNA (cytosine(1402)-N(4))-methyltransferase RsmH [Planctomycetota bacterium]|nr:16S rRNA (cytosine(1402)-N(4))-methyltransferase RsmH [Planctomycetota bacterium]